MGFSIKVFPGVRIGVSKRGMNASLGPRAARVHLGSGRVRYSSGIGPITVSGGGGGYRRSRFKSSGSNVQNESYSSFEIYERHPDGHHYAVEDVGVKLHSRSGPKGFTYWDVIYFRGKNKVIASVEDREHADMIAMGLVPLPGRRKRTTKLTEASKIKRIRPKGYVGRWLPSDDNVSLFAHKTDKTLPVVRTDYDLAPPYVHRLYVDRATALKGADSGLLDTLETDVVGNVSTRWTYEQLNKEIAKRQKLAGGNKGAVKPHPTK